MKEEKKSYWIFYLNSNIDLYNVIAYDIYAFTDDKEIANKFIRTRNMDMFYTKKVKMTREEINLMLRDYMIYELEIVECMTKLNESYTPGKLLLPLTRKEKLSMQASMSLYLNEHILVKAWNEPYGFKNKYIKSLDKLLYLGLHSFINGDDDEMYNKTIQKMKFNDFNFLLRNYRKLFIKSKERSDD